jgi:hypothetical protein
MRLARNKKNFQSPFHRLSKNRSNARTNEEKERSPAFTKSYPFLNKVNTFARCLTNAGGDGFLLADYATDLGHLLTESVL